MGYGERVGMKTRAHKYFALFAFGLLLMELGGARLLWIRHEQRQDAIAQQMQVRAQKQQKTAQEKVTQAQAARLVAQNTLQDNIKEHVFLSRMDELNSALSKAADEGQVGRARQLIKRGASVNRLDYEEWEEAPLLCAVEAHHIQMVRLLLAHGAVCNFLTGRTTPLISAARQGDNAIVKELLAHGAEVDDNVKLGTALVFAAEEGHLEDIKFFEERRVYDARTFTKDTKILRLLNHYRHRIRH